MQLATNWNSKTTKDHQTELSGLLQNTIEPTVPDYIQLVLAGKYEGVYASQGPNFEYAIFGRDSIEVAEDLLETHQQVAYDIIHELARLQGVKYDPRSEEETGKIHHEYRYAFFGGHRIPSHSESILHTLQQKWGGERSDVMVYYGTCDATPLYVRLIGSYVDLYGSAMLEHTFVGRDGREHDMFYSLKQAVAWIANKVESSSWGLLEYKRLNPDGLANQSWKDSDTACLFSDGTTANVDGGVATIELQAYAYDALLVGAQLLTDPAMRHRCVALAQRIQSQLLPLFWIPQLEFFAQGLDRDAQGKTRQIDTFTSNPALLLDSQILLGSMQVAFKTYRDKLVETIMGSDFLTSAGLRSRAWQHHSHPGFADYHGSYTVWPKETYDIARGLRRHGFTVQAAHLEKCILNTVAGAGEFYEFFYVDGQAKIFYSSEGLTTESPAPDRTPLEHPAKPEPGQAWTISAFMNCLERNYLDAGLQIIAEPIVIDQISTAMK